jgi:hypothetical protein
MNDNETQQMAQPIYYDDGRVIHACDSAITDRGVRLVWTKCDMDVPEDRSFTVEGEAPAISCPECLARIG